MYRDIAPKLLENGYQPIPIKPGTKRPLNKAWQQESGPEIVQQNIQRFPDWSVGVSNANALDFDIMDQEICKLLEDKVNELHPGYLKRVGQAPKFIVVISPDSDIQRKSKHTWYDGDQKHEIEILHKGQQQFVAYGIHPDTKSAYTWYGSDPYATPITQLAIWSQKDINTLLAYFDTLCEQRGFKQENTGPDRPNTPTVSAQEREIWNNIPAWAANTAKENNFQIPPETLPLDILKQYLDKLPIKYCDERESWFRIGGIIYDITEGSPEGFQIFDDWSKRSTKYNQTPGDTTALKWRGYTTKPGNAGLGTLMHWVEAEGVTIDPPQAPEAPQDTPGWTVVQEGADQPAPPGTQDYSVVPALTLQECLNRYVYIQETNTVGDLVRGRHIPVSNFKNLLLPYTPPRPPGDAGAPTLLSNRWLKHPSRKVVDNITYYPDPSVVIHDWEGGKYFNLYRPPLLPYIESYDLAVFQPFMDHLHYMFPDDAARNFILDWAAYSVQCPTERCTFAILIVSDQGIGKDVLFEMMSKCVGERNARRVTSTALKKSSDFNGFLVENVMLLVDEIKVKGVGYDDLKEMVTARRKEINKKFSTMQQEDLYSNILMFTNHNDALTLESDERRFFVYESPAKFIDDSQYYKRLFDGILKSDTMAAHFRSFLMQRDISKFEPKKKPPVTEAKIEMEEAAMEPVSRIVSRMLDNKWGPFKYDIISYALAVHCIDTDKVAGGHVTYTQLSRALKNRTKKKIFPIRKLAFRDPIGPENEEINSKYPRVFCIRNHAMWAQAEPGALRREFLRAHTAAVSPSKTKDQITEEVSKKEV